MSKLIISPIALELLQDLSKKVTPDLAADINNILRELTRDKAGAQTIMVNGKPLEIYVGMCFDCDAGTEEIVYIDPYKDIAILRTGGKYGHTTPWSYWRIAKLIEQDVLKVKKEDQYIQPTLKHYLIISPFYADSIGCTTDPDSVLEE